MKERPLLPSAPLSKQGYRCKVLDIIEEDNLRSLKKKAAQRECQPYDGAAVIKSSTPKILIKNEKDQEKRAEPITSDRRRDPSAGSGLAASGIAIAG